MGLDPGATLGISILIPIFALALVFDGDTVTSARVFLSGAAPGPWRPARSVA